MGSLRESFKTDVEAVNKGITVELLANPNNDEGKTIPKFKLARYSHQNKEFAKLLRKIHDNCMKKYGVVSIDKLTPTQSAEMDLEIFLETVLKGWENFQPDEDGVNLEYSKENARRIFSDESWFDLYTRLQKEASEKDNFSQVIAEASAKN